MGAASPAIICVLDDDQSVLRATSRLLISAGWQVEPFIEPISFLNHAAANRPPVAVVDVLMPAMNGLEVQSRLRHVSPNTRVIILTSRDDQSIYDTAIAAGAVGFFVKPFDDDAFLAMINLAVSAR
jgi:two-component system response regulator HydG